MKNIILIILCTFFFTGASLSYAGESQTKEIASLDTIIITATRTEANIGKSGGSSVSVITAEDIKAKGFMTLGNILKSVPGIDIVSSGGFGKKSSMFIRGADSKNTLVLIDGIMFNDPSTPARGANIADLTVNNIERIEIVRGPQSVLYGSNATAGVINIITKKGKGKVSVYAGSEYGSYNTWKVYTGSSGASGNINYSLDVSNTNTDGFSAADDDNDLIPHNQNTSEDDSWENTTLSTSLGIDINSNFNVKATLRHVDSETDLDDWGPGFAGDRFKYDSNLWMYVAEPEMSKKAMQDTKQTFGRFEINNSFMSHLIDTKIYYNNSKIKRTSYDNNGNFDSKYKSLTDESGFQASLNFENNIITFGSSHFYESYETDTSSKKSCYTNSIWAQNQFFWKESLSAVIGIRWDDNEAFGNKTTYRIAPSYTFTSINTTFKGSYGTGFRSPSLYELYADSLPMWGFTGGNQNLDPEKSKGWDAGFEQSFIDNQLIFGVTYFKLNFDNKITYVTDSNTFQSTYENISGKTKTEGIESFIKWTLFKSLGFSVNYTYTHAKAPDNTRLVRRPLNKVSFNTKYKPTDTLLINLDANWHDKQDEIYAKDKEGNAVLELDSYTVINISAIYDVCDYFQIYGRIDNIFDKYYEETWSYAVAGLSGYVGIKVKY